MTMRTRQYLAEKIRKRLLIRLTLGLVGLAVAMAAGAAMFVLWGVYNVSALQQHTKPVYSMLSTALDRSISQRADEIVVPSLEDPAMIQRGSMDYRDKCVQCHGAPGVARDDVGKGMTPVPPNLAHAARNRTPAEIFWAIKHGIKMTGMPSWQFIFNDQEVWEIVAFIRHMPQLSPTEYQTLVERSQDSDWVLTHPADQLNAPVVSSVAQPDPERGRLAMYGYACIACHRIPGMVGPQADVGPPLAGIAGRRYMVILPKNSGSQK